MDQEGREPSEPNLYRRGKVWCFRIQIRGKDKRRSLRTTVLSEAKKRLKQILKDADEFRVTGQTRYRWKDAVVEWRKEPGVKASVVKRYTVSLGQVRPILDHLYLDQIDRKVIGQIARRVGVTNATKRRDLTAVSAVLRWAVAHGWREDNPARTWDRSVIKERRDPIMLPKPEDIDAVVAEAPGNFAKLIQWARYTGMREEEAASLERSEVSLIRKAADLSKTKTDRPRSVPLDDRALGTFTGTVQHLTGQYVFWHGEGERYANVASRFAELTKRAERKAFKAGKPFRRFRFHDLRHWFAVDYLRRGGNIYTLQKILGHSSIKTTEIYLDHLTPEEQGIAKGPAQIMAQ